MCAFERKHLIVTEHEVRFLSFLESKPQGPIAAPPSRPTALPHHRAALSSCRTMPGWPCSAASIRGVIQPSLPLPRIVGFTPRRNRYCTNSECPPAACRQRRSARERACEIGGAGAQLGQRTA